MVDNEQEVSGYISVGSRIKNARVDQGIALRDLAHELKITDKILEALEKSDFSKLPAPVYAKGFVKMCAEYLGLDGEELVKDFSNELHGAQETTEQKITPQQLRSFHRPFFLITPRITTITAGILVVFIALGYLFFEVRGFTRAPALSLSSPLDNAKIKSNDVLVKGKTDTTAEVKINGEKTFVKSDGTFEESVGVGPGVNKISVSAKSIGGKERVLEREVLVEQSQPEVGPSASPNATASPVVSDGNTQLKIKTDSDVWVSVLVDGKTMFSGTMNIGQEKDFSGKSISVTAGKANKVQVQKDGGKWVVLADTPGVAKNVLFGENPK
jgi:cytoskeletal protein RodZ